MVRLIYLLFLSILLVGEYFCEEVHSSFSPKDVRGCIPSDTLADPWSPNADYPLWTLVRHRGELYQCCQPHRSTPEWAPSKVPSLWQIPTPCGTTEWRVQTAYQVGSVVTFNSQTYTCIQAHTSVDGWEPPATPALWNIVPGARAGTCVFTAQGGEIRQHIEARSSRSSGKSALVIMDVVLTPSDGPPHAFSGLVFSASILLGADEVLSYHKTVLPDDTSHIELHWGPAVIGATSAVFDVRADQTVTGSIDGRRLAPFKITDTTSTLKLADGQALPSLHPQFDASSAFESLEVEIEAAVRSCNGPPSANTSTILRSRRDALDRTQDPGHFSFTKSADSCWFCKGAATGAVTTGTVICAVATCALTFGLSCAACVGGEAVADCAASAARSVSTDAGAVAPGARQTASAWLAARLASHASTKGSRRAPAAPTPQCAATNAVQGTTTAARTVYVARQAVSAGHSAATHITQQSRPASS
ncbi:hypothetical protein FNYG_15598 [Fusarium nygamai]|uniref:Chitin-binding type-3 domain-containing protein n=1 Tax=Gibberella nygamai TaxID=42673 RepID=A0A2K0UAL1_GIBNY|nr:hypothetical protein FNYG_15598 [Fusarium nygamai]